MAANSTVDSDEPNKPGNHIIETRLDRPFNMFGMAEANPYVTQLIDILQKKNRNLSIFIGTSLILAIISGFVALKFYYDSQILTTTLETEEVQAQSILKERDKIATELTLKNSEIATWINSLKKGLTDNAASIYAPDDPVITRIKLASDMTSLVTEATSVTHTAASRLKALEQDKSDMADGLAKLNNDNQTLKASYKALQNSISEKSAELATTMDMIDAINTERDTVIKELQRQTTMFQNENVELQKEINKRKSAFDALAQRYQETKSLREKSATEADRANSALAEKERLLKAKESRLATAEQNLTSMQTKYTELENSLKAVTQPMHYNSPLNQTTPRVEPPAKSALPQTIP